MTDHKVMVSDTIGVSESISARTESQYLIISNKEKCRGLVEKNEWTDENLIDFFISLHLVLEVSLNTFFRLISLCEMQKTIDSLKLIENLDNINFIDKVVLFIYNSKFDFKGNINDANKYHSVIGSIRDFSGIRNKLIHGHSISVIHENGDSRESNLRSRIIPQNVQLQINKFKFIMEGMQFYFDHLESNYTDSGKISLKREYLDYEFLII